MILQSLSEYYRRKTVSKGDALVPLGYEDRAFRFILVVDEDGNLVNLEDHREKKNKADKGTNFLVPLSQGRTGNQVKPNLLWDHNGYVLGVAVKDDEKSQEQAQKQHEAFLAQINELIDAGASNKEVVAVKRFLENPNSLEAVRSHPNWEDYFSATNRNLTFRLRGATDPVCYSTEVQEYIKETFGGEESNESDQDVCLVTGQKASVERLHSAIRGFESPAPLCSANDPAYESYGKKQGAVYPVSKQAVFEYTSALNYLLSSEQNRFRLGNDIKAVCFSQKKEANPARVGSLLVDNTPKDQPDDYTETVKQLYRSFHRGRYVASDADAQIYVLGLSANKARLVVRLWVESTVAEIMTNFRSWFEDIRLDRSEKLDITEFLPLMRMMSSLVFQGKTENLPPNLVANVSESILKDTRLPVTLLQMAVRRCRQEQGVSFSRASLIKGYLNRNIRLHNKSAATSDPTSKQLKKEISVSYDINRIEVGYQLGALFAVLEKIQRDSAPGQKINSTIKDRFYGSASSTPITVFATLIKLTQHHLSKISKGKNGQSAERYLSGQMGQILDKIESFPSHLNMEQQGLFALGYYHKNVELYKPKKDDKPAEDEIADEATTD